MSLRARLLVGLGAVAVVLVVAAIGVTRTAQSYLLDQVDARLPTHPPPAQGEPVFGPYYFGELDPGDDTVRIFATPDLGEGTAALPDIDAAQARAAAAGSDHYFTVGSDGDGPRYRVRATRDDDGDRHGATTSASESENDSGRINVVAASLADTDATVSRLVAVEVATTGVVLTLLGLVAFWVLRLGVRPLKEMTRAATVIADDISHRVPSAPEGTEAAELGTALNRMLGRIETSFAEQQATEDRLRQFVADASHELRTPVTTIRGYAELHRRGALDDPDELAQAMRRTESEAERMARLVDDMLLLARLDQGRPVERRPVDLGVLAIDAASDARAVAPERTVRAQTEEGVVVEGDEHRLRQVLANLVRNALVHTPPWAIVRVSVRREPDGGPAVAEVADDGPGMSRDQAAHAFDRFYRADSGRARDRGGSGLGLAIVQAIANAHGGRATLATAPGGGTRVRVELPAAEQPSH
jgi:two-component system, OmpR family, sensor kinase